MEFKSEIFEKSHMPALNSHIRYFPGTCSPTHQLGKPTMPAGPSNFHFGKFNSCHMFARYHHHPRRIPLTTHDVGHH